MSATRPEQTRSGLVGRVWGILTAPRTTWARIEAEPATGGRLYRGYVIPLALIPAISGLVGLVVFGHRQADGLYHYSVAAALVREATVFGLALLHVYVLTRVINGFAPVFGGIPDHLQALKVAAYASTAIWLAGVFLVYPPLGFIGLVGFYSLYLLYLGLPRLMKVNEDQALAYAAVVVVIALLLFICLGAAVEEVSRLVIRPVITQRSQGRLTTLPGGDAVDLARLQAESRRLDAAARQSGKQPLTDPQVLKAYLPAAVAGFTRIDVSTQSAGVDAAGSATATGAYTKGDLRARLAVSDLGSAAALVGIAGAFDLQSSHEGNGRYDNVGKVDGRMTTESYDKVARHGEYNVLVGDRFMVHAEGDGVGMDVLKALVGAVDKDRLQALAKPAA